MGLLLGRTYPTQYQHNKDAHYFQASKVDKRPPYSIQQSLKSCTISPSKTPPTPPSNPRKHPNQELSRPHQHSPTEPRKSPVTPSRLNRAFASLFYLVELSSRPPSRSTSSSTLVRTNIDPGDSTNQISFSASSKYPSHLTPPSIHP